MKTCQWCDNTFETHISYKIYCSTECREQSAKDKISQRHALARRKKMMNKVRKCVSCEQQLSAYNDEQLCATCLVNPKEVSLTLKMIKKISEGKYEL
jgi:hypothetical protein